MQISPVKILFTSETSWRRLQVMSSRRLEDIFSVTIFRLPRRLEDVLKTFSRRLARDPQDVLEDVKLLCWRPVEDVFKTNKCLLGTLFAYHWNIHYPVDKNRLKTVWRYHDKQLLLQYCTLDKFVFSAGYSTKTCWNGFY